ncbi:hypothetical protein FNV43_RR10461 [Rhamnella rubrinervis]|uniref:Alpha 1,4-glycosyltransferase domain-containing protein n=1 Tax=Rhamnella rubrinervis TaxID=2594499 RepID=A0A8K0HD87_9ROSA|nr:hypothetical protein FNV43_RR10461 [Rhamnella rubrinervis]
MDKKLSGKLFWSRLFSRTAKSPIFSTISFIVIFFMIYADSIVSNLSMNPLDFKNNNILDPSSQTQKPQQQSQPAAFATDARDEVDITENDHDPLIPPENITKQERIIWFRRKLPELEIFHSNNLTQRFHSRVLEFLNHGCTVQFYMVWLSPAKSFGKREVLAVDSLFKTNSKACLMIISRTMDSESGYRILKPFLDRRFRVLAISPDLPFLVKNTPAETWLQAMTSGTRDPGYIPMSQNLCNLIRLAMLYKYGGVYLDTDFIILKDLSELRNSVGAQSVDHETKNWTRLNGAVMIFDINHPLLVDFIEEFASTFNGNKWGHNGPFLVSRVIERVGSTSGYNVTVLPPKAFYPVDWIKIRRLFKKPENGVESRWAESMLNELNDGETYAVHLWNKRSRELKIEEGSVMARLILDHCVVCEDIYSS